MEIQAIKLELIKMLLEMDEVKVLEKVRDVLLLNGSHRKEEDDEIVGYRAGEPITQSQFSKEMEIAIHQAKNGEVVSQEDFIKESENW